ncbi:MULTISPECIES: hypothetical protein [Nonomuraea]|uniref:hypothetical protein n=1 Tax=Nonomuraea TaxID=83681 RepID=UPI001C601339|nr:hypothetical protein [Nonomuraea ceibae]
MIRRRFAVLGAVAVLALAGLGGSALAADDVPHQVTCTTPDGKTVELEVAKAVPAIPAEPAGQDWVKADEPGAIPTDVLDAEAATEVEFAPARPATEAGTEAGAGPTKVVQLETISCVRKQ